MSAKHTPAPWRFLPKVGYIMGTDKPGPFGPGVVQVGTVGAYRDKELLQFSKERWDADGRLISAAPDLLAALKALQLQALQSELNSPAHEWGYEALALTQATIA